MKVSDRVIWSPEDEDGACGLLDAVPRSVVSLELLHTEFGLQEYIDEDETREFFNRQHHDTFDILLDEDDYWPNLRLVQIYNIRRKFFDENGLFDKDLEDQGWTLEERLTKGYTGVQVIRRGRFSDGRFSVARVVHPCDKP